MIFVSLYQDAILDYQSHISNTILNIDKHDCLYNEWSSGVRWVVKDSNVLKWTPSAIGSVLITVIVLKLLTLITEVT